MFLAALKYMYVYTYAIESPFPKTNLGMVKTYFINMYNWRRRIKEN